MTFTRLKPTGSRFTQVTVTGTYAPGGIPASGTVTFTLTQAMSNGDVILPASPIVATLDEHGHFEIELAPNDDEATVPTGVQYGVTEGINGAQPRDYFILLTHTTSPVDIATLMPGDTGWT